MKHLDKHMDGYCAALPFVFEMVNVRVCGGAKDDGRSKRSVRITTPGYNIVSATDTMARDLKIARTFLTVSGPAGVYQLVFNRRWGRHELHRISEAETEEDVNDLLHWALADPVTEYRM